MFPQRQTGARLQDRVAGWGPPRRDRFCPSHPNQFSNVMAELQRRFRTAKTWGDCYAYVLVATGRADVAIDQRMNTWDCAALMPIIEQAGGTFTDWKGNRTIRGGNAIATNGRLLEQTLEIINSKKLSKP